MWTSCRHVGALLCWALYSGGAGRSRQSWGAYRYGHAYPIRGQMTPDWNLGQPANIPCLQTADGQLLATHPDDLAAALEAAASSMAGGGRQQLCWLMVAASHIFGGGRPVHGTCGMTVRPGPKLHHPQWTSLPTSIPQRRSSCATACGA